MLDRDLYRTILGVEVPWQVADVDFDKRPLHPDSPNPLLHWEGEVTITVEHDSSTALVCPKCLHPCSGYDHRTRRWRHLDTCQFKTIVVCDVPRVRCEKHGVQQVKVSWAESGARFTALFEALAISWLQEASFSAVARLLHLSWDQVDGIMGRAVQRGLARRTATGLRRIAVDETSFQKRHEYVTVVTNQDGNRVEYIADGRNRAALDGFWARLSAKQIAQVETVSMDMWQPYIQSTLKHIPDAKSKICYDKFHVAKHLGDAVDAVRRTENHDLWKDGDARLKGSKYLWLQNPEHMAEERWTSFSALRESTLKTARAWQLKETAMQLWHYARRSWARRAWRKWLSWAFRSRLAPIRAVARMVKKHLEGILNAIVENVTNAGAESINAKIQKIKRQACGFRNRNRFRNAIYFHCGGLDMSPKPITHTKS